jgi:hypothetical protein
MRLDNLNFDPSDRVQADQVAKRIPPAELIGHQQIREAIERYEKAREDLNVKRRDETQAEQNLPEAEQLDALALADAQEQGAKDPGVKHRKRALDEIAEARRQHAAARITLERAVAGVSAAFEQSGDEYENQLHAEAEKLREAAGELLEGWERIHADLQRNAANLAIGSGFIRPVSSFLGSISGPGGVMPVTDALARLKALGAPPEPKPQQLYEHRRHPGQTSVLKETQDRRHPGQTETPVDQQAHAEQRAVQEADRAEGREIRERRIASGADIRARREAQRDAEREVVGF